MPKACIYAGFRHLFSQMALVWLYLCTKHPLINPKNFLGDAAFDTAQLYKSLLTGDTFGNDKHFSKAYIPLNARSGLENLDYSINEDGIPCCPHDPSLQMKYEGTSKLRSGVTRYKFVCPKMKWIYDKSTQKAHRHCFCDTPCTSSKCGRMVYIWIFLRQETVIPEQRKPTFRIQKPPLIGLTTIHKKLSQCQAQSRFAGR